MADYFLHFKALHLIFVVTWFAGLFYIPRLFVYHIEAQDKPPLEKDILSKQLKMMSKRLWLFMTWPSAILAAIIAVVLIAIVPSWLWQPWMWLKLTFVFGLILYHLKLNQMYRELQKNIFRHSSFRMRLWNGGAIFFLVVIVFLEFLKDSLKWIYGLLGVLVLTGGLYWVIRSYNHSRENRGS